MSSAVWALLGVYHHSSLPFSRPVLNGTSIDPKCAESSRVFQGAKSRFKMAEDSPRGGIAQIPSEGIKEIQCQFSSFIFLSVGNLRRASTHWLGAARASGLRHF